MECVIILIAGVWLNTCNINYMKPSSGLGDNCAVHFGYQSYVRVKATCATVDEMIKGGDDDRRTARP